MMLDLWRLTRPRQAAKSLVVLVPLLFSGHVTDGPAAILALTALLGFVLLSMGVYVANDILDAPRDRAHPTKSKRPIASGRVSSAAGILLAITLVASGLFVLGAVNLPTLAIGIAYALLQVAYNAGLKHVLLWDVLVLAIGFVLRALAGSTAIHVGAPTVWLIVCTFLFALHLGLAKRRRELQVLEASDSDPQHHRPTLGLYTVPYVESLMVATTAILLVAYSLYSFTGTNPWMMATLPFAFYGIFRFNWLIQQKSGDTDETDAILRDRPSLVNGILWIVLVAVVQKGLLDGLGRWLGA